MAGIDVKIKYRAAPSDTTIFVLISMAGVPEWTIRVDLVMPVASLEAAGGKELVEQHVVSAVNNHISRSLGLETKFNVKKVEGEKMAQPLRSVEVIIRGPHDTGRSTLASFLKMFLEEHQYSHVTVIDTPPLPAEQKDNFHNRMMRNRERPVVIKIETIEG